MDEIQELSQQLADCDRILQRCQKALRELKDLELKTKTRRQELQQRLEALVQAQPERERIAHEAASAIS